MTMAAFHSLAVAILIITILYVLAAVSLKPTPAFAEPVPAPQ
jgi:hypothetical protein